jgi:hypothetical protein
MTMPKPETEPISSIKGNNDFSRINPEAGRQLITDEKGGYTSINNAELTALKEGTRGEVKCACDGSAKETHACLNNCKELPNTSHEVLALIMAKERCALAGLKYLAKEE